ncbi:MAG: hypothetical protein ACF8LL_03445 [Phycisphaerales bacterium]
MNPLLDCASLPLPPSEIEAAVRAACDAIEEHEIPLLEALEQEDRPVWIRFEESADGRVTGAAIRETPPPGDEANGYFRDSRLALWQKMSHASACVEAVLQSMAVPEDLRLDREWHEQWAPLLASGGHGFRLFEMDFARNVLPGFDGMYRRAFELSCLVMLRPPTHRAARYLRRLPRAYVFGLDAEVLILCRSAIEAALKDRAEAAGRDNLQGLLKRAETEGWLAPDDLTAANHIRRSANAVVHDDPASDLRALEAISDTIRIIKRLLPEEDG